MADTLNAQEPTAEDPEQGEGETREDILKEARDRFAIAEDVDGENRDRQADDTKFVWVKGAQWEQDAYDAREGWDQPCLEASQLTQFVKQVVNDQRQARPGIIVSAASGDASAETAKILQGMIRHIEVDSQAEAAYDSAFEHAVTGGRGFLRVLTDYENSTSFDQKLIIKRVQDPMSVYPDPYYREPDGSDMNWCFVVETMTRKAFEAAYPDAEPLDWEGASEYGDWMKDGVQVADYFRRMSTRRVLVAMSDGAVGWKDEMPSVLPPGVTVVREREVTDYKVEWYKVAGGQQILETLPWVGKTIPVIVVPGNEIWVEGKREFQGLIRRARDTQMLYNYLISAAAERVALAPKAPWVMAEGQDEGHEAQWKSANIKPYSRLIYKPTTIGDQLAPPPQRQSPVQAEMGLLNHAEMCKADIKSILGMYESSLGQRGNETSGRAILAREKQSDNATFDFVDNLGRAIALTGRIILECIPAIYDTERVVGIVNPDDTRETAPINQPQMQVDPFTGAVNAIKKNDISVGKYAVTVSAGPSYATKRQENADSLMAFMQAFPPAAQVTGDLVAKSMDWADAEVLAERLKYLLPPEVRQAEEAKKQGQTPPDPQMMAQMQQLEQGLQQAQQVMAQMQQELQQAQASEQAKIAETQARGAEAQAKIAADAQAAAEKARADAAAKITTAQIDAQATIEVAKIKAQAECDAKMMAQMMMPPEAPEPAEPGELNEMGETGETEEPGEGQEQRAPVFLELIDALRQTTEALTAATLAPRDLKIRTDAMGNVIGATSSVVGTLQ